MLVVVIAVVVVVQFVGFHGSENGLKEFQSVVLLGAKSDKLVHQPASLLLKKINIITKRVRVDVPTSHMVQQLQFRDVLWDRLLPSLDEVHTLVPDQVKNLQKKRPMYFQATFVISDQ